MLNVHIKALWYTIYIFDSDLVWRLMIIKGKKIVLCGFREFLTFNAIFFLFCFLQNNTYSKFLNAQNCIKKDLEIYIFT